MDTSRLISEITTILDSKTAQRAPNQMVQVASEYAKAIRELNDLLAQCDELLRAGFRSEAIRIAETEPRLLDRVAAFDFPERNTWARLLDEHGLPSPPELLSEIAVRLHESYAMEQQLGGLLRRHRLYSLARSPLKARIGILRRIARIDQTHPIWERELRVLKKARHIQLSVEVSEAVERNDDKTLTTLLRELVDGDWLEPPPQELVDKATLARMHLRQKEVLSQWADEPKEMTSEALSNFELELEQRLRDLRGRQAPVERRDEADVQTLASIEDSAGSTLYLHFGDATLRIDIADPTCAVKISAEEMTIENTGEPIRIRTSEGRLVVERDDLQVETRAFCLKRAGSLALRAALVDGNLVVKGDDETMENGPASE